MQPEKNLVEEALIQMKQIEDVLAENAKGILSSTMKEEIEELVKESLNEQTDIEDDETDLDMEDEDMEDDMEDIEDDMEDDEMDMEDDVIDMRGSSEDELIKVFKAMGDEDGIIVSKDGDDISLTDDDDEYLIRLGEQISEFGDEDMDDEMDFEDDDDEMEMDFEDDDDEMEMDFEDDDEMAEMYEDDTQSTINKIFEKTNNKKSNIIYEIEMDEQMDIEDDMDMEDDMDWKMMVWIVQILAQLII